MREEAVDDRAPAAASNGRPPSILAPWPRAALPLRGRRGLEKPGLPAWSCLCGSCLLLEAGPGAATVLLGRGQQRANDGSCAARSVRVRRRAAMTRSDGVDGRYAQRYEQRFAPAAWPRQKEKGGGGQEASPIGMFDDTGCG